MIVKFFSISFYIWICFLYNTKNGELMKKIFPDYSEKIAEFGVHDPSIIKSGGKYYTISTHGFFQFRESSDLVHWIDAGKSCFDSNSIQNELKEGISYCKVNVPKSRREGSPFWAPDIIRIGRKFFLYYSISSFGSTLSFIGLAKADKIFGEYKDAGCVQKSVKGGNITLPNAIDPCVRRDKTGKLWLSYGSFFGGIYIKELDQKTGLSVDKNDIGTHISGGKMAPEEGSYIIYNKYTDYYYLFVSFGGLTDSYNVRVARSKNITGPYYDPMGRVMTDADWDNLGGMLIANYHFAHQADTYTAPGHNSVLQDGKKFFIIHHTRLNKRADKHYLNVRRMYFNELGWPVVMPNRYAFDTPYMSNKNIDGKYNVIHFTHKTSAQTFESKTIDIALNKNLNKHNKYVQFDYENKTYYGVISKLYDEGMSDFTLGFSAMSSDGESVFAIKVTN